MDRTLVLVDASVVIHRIDHLVKKYQNSDPTWIVGMLDYVNTASFLLFPRREYKVLWLMDCPYKEYWRYQYEPTYKGNRLKNDSTFDDVHTLCTTHIQGDYAFLQLPTFEADDLAGAICRLYPRVRKFLVTSDSDWQGLIVDQTTAMLTPNAPLFRESLQVWSHIRAKHQKFPKWARAAYTLPAYQDFQPPEIWKWKSVTGDRVDNLPRNTPLGLISLYEPFVDALKLDGFPKLAKAAIVQAPIWKPTRQDAQGFLKECIDLPLPIFSPLSITATA